MGENRRIAKNSFILYTSLAIKTLVGLYVARIVLLELGAADYGLYAVVAGIVTMLGFISTAMLATSYRFIAVEIGKGDRGDINKVFNASLVIHLILALFILIIGETIGIYYINNYLNAAPSKIPDAIFVLHFALLASMFSIVCVPLNGLISAKENFLIRASVDIIGMILNLVLVLLLILYIGNKLRAYSIIMAIVMSIPLVLLITYCRIKYRDIVIWKFNRKISDYFEMISFTGWALISVIAYMGVRQGAAILINLFFGTVVNAAFGISSQVNNYVMLFVKNLNQAAIPQIMKSHSGGDSERSLNLVYYISKYAFLIILIPVVPLFLSIDNILLFWLKEVPEFTSQFTIFLIINGLIGVTSAGFEAAIQATGNIRKATIWYSTLMFLNLPIAYILFKFNYPPYIITVIQIIATVAYRFVQINILKRITKFKTSDYFYRTVLPTFLVCLLTVPQIWLRKFFGQDLIGVMIFSIISVFLTLITIYFVGLSNHERYAIKEQIIRFKIKFRQHKFIK
jgi:O-antigen/teichoic acid export membrane protein